MRANTANLTKIALLVALSFALGFIESTMPLPVAIPGVKLGLANIVVLVALYLLDGRIAFCLMLLKVGISAMLYASAMVIAYSLAGGLLSFVLMWLLKRTGKVSIVIVSMVGAVAHNIGQILVATFLLQTPAIMLYLPLLVVVACVTGSITGTAAMGVVKALKSLRPNSQKPEQEPSQEKSHKQAQNRLLLAHPPAIPSQNRGKRQRLE